MNSDNQRYQRSISHNTIPTRRRRCIRLQMNVEASNRVRSCTRATPPKHTKTVYHVFIPSITCFKNRLRTTMSPFSQHEGMVPSIQPIAAADIPMSLSISLPSPQFHASHPFLHLYHPPHRTAQQVISYHRLASQVPVRSPPGPRHLPPQQAMAATSG